MKHLKIKYKQLKLEEEVHKKLKINAAKKQKPMTKIIKDFLERDKDESTQK